MATSGDFSLGRTTVLMAEDGGKYPDGNSLLVLSLIHI